MNIFRPTLIKTSLLLLILNSCSIAGSWVYERLDNYLANYFFEFADFSEDQREKIRSITKDYQLWFSKSELPKINNLLIELKNSNQDTNKKEIEGIYEKGFKIFKSTNSYFAPYLVEISKSLTKSQVDQVENHFSEMQKERDEKNIERLKKPYEERILENYNSGLRRLGIELKQQQLNRLSDSLKQMEDSGDEWNLLQKEWNSKLITILKTNKTTDFEENLNAHLEELYILGSTSFRDNTEKNQDVIISSLTDIIKSLDATQRKKLTRRLNVYQKSLRKIIKN
jgi:hypothetical protein